MKIKVFDLSGKFRFKHYALYAEKAAESRVDITLIISYNLDYIQQKQKELAESSTRIIFGEVSLAKDPNNTEIGPIKKNYNFYEKDDNFITLVRAMYAMFNTMYVPCCEPFSCSLNLSAAEIKKYDQ